MLITGDVQIHKSSGTTRDCMAVIHLQNGDLAVYDSLPDSKDWKYRPDENVIMKKTYSKEVRMIEPDIIVHADSYERVERKDVYWDRLSSEAVLERAKSRGDVDVNDLPDNL